MGKNDWLIGIFCLPVANVQTWYHLNQGSRSRFSSGEAKREQTRGGGGYGSIPPGKYEI